MRVSVTITPSKWVSRSQETNLTSLLPVRPQALIVTRRSPGWAQVGFILGPHRAARCLAGPDLVGGGRRRQGDRWEAGEGEQQGR